MTTRRFHLPRRRPTRKPGSHLRPRARRTTDAARTSRTGVAAAIALLALTVGTATAVSPLADGTTTVDEPSVVAVTPDETPTDEDSPEETPDATAEPSYTTTVAATTALQRAQEVTSESTTLSAKKERRIEAEADQVAELLGTRDDAAASRSAERTPLPVPDPTDGSAAGSADADPADESPADESPAGQETPTAEPEDAETSPEGGEAPTGEASDDELAEATQELTSLLKKAESDVEVEAAPATPAEILAAQKKEAAAAADELAAKGGSTADYANGRIPSDVMCELSFASGEMLRCDAATQLERLDAAYRAEFGAHLSIRDSYRSYESQVATKAAKGYLAAVPGYSNHGWGVAVDLSGGVESFGTARYEWLRANAPEFGWDNPGWARAGGSKPEAWHWEYKAP
ncbi:M15 family metallopeptidase [Isoptericola halotolerans]|uniref:M15 family metallopeptidase n=1 Tax=Isoptericola halotolerans TaxID=300560 RepID=UPI00388E6FAA